MIYDGRYAQVWVILVKKAQFVPHLFRKIPLASIQSGIPVK